MPRSLPPNALMLSVIAAPPWAWWLFCSLSFAGWLFWCGFRKVWPADSGNSGTLLEGLSAVVLGVLEVARPVGRAA